MPRQPIKKAPPSHVIDSPPRAITLAIKSLATGTANDIQQKQALQWIIQVASGTYDLCYRADADGGERATLIAEGRRIVGLVIVKEINISPGHMKEE